MVVIRDPKLFVLILIGLQTLKNEIELIIKSNESLAENKIKKEIEQLLSIYKHGNDINE